MVKTILEKVLDAVKQIEHKTDTLKDYIVLIDESTYKDFIGFAKKHGLMPRQKKPPYYIMGRKIIIDEWGILNTDTKACVMSDYDFETLRDIRIDHMEAGYE